MKRLMASAAFLVVCAVFSSSAMAAPLNCGQVTILKITAGSSSMMQVSNSSCGGAGGWLCIDPEAQPTLDKGKRLYNLILAQYLLNRSFQLTINDGTYAAACPGPFPIVQDVGTL